MAWLWLVAALTVVMSYLQWGASGQQEWASKNWVRYENWCSWATGRGEPGAPVKSQS